jgi:hypothetical protein
MDTFLFDAFSQLTGGIVTDLKTAMLGIFTIFLIIIGWEKLISVLSENNFNRIHSDENLMSLKEKRDISSGFQRDYYNRAYNIRLNSRIKKDLRRGKI